VVKVVANLDLPGALSITDAPRGLRSACDQRRPRWNQLTPYKRKKGRKLGKRKQLFNRYHAKVRAVGERGAATLKQWHILRKARCSPSRMTAVVQAILTLEYQDR